MDKIINDIETSQKFISEKCDTVNMSTITNKSIIETLKQDVDSLKSSNKTLFKKNACHGNWTLHPPKQSQILNISMTLPILPVIVQRFRTINH
ncbi:hypothetical protein MAR_010602 [Mya arenaria]|uniref:Uncharacterized protein n=1 Tax=Mya arenaria TaxID=6604 RepID=A0ABY7E4B3_MYAAR|nr:hypothetical protein MAR_010602 [Mya arenaria]